jgi:predicted HTH transcriptional regulator
MANTYGGVIILGVKENEDGSWYTTGLRDVSVIKKFFWDTINNRNKVSLNLLREADLEEYSVGEDYILVVHVPVADREQRPIYLNNNLFDCSFKRNHEGDYRCTRQEVRRCFEIKPGKLWMEQHYRTYLFLNWIRIVSVLQICS